MGHREDMKSKGDVLAVKGSTGKPDPGREEEDVHIRIEGERALDDAPLAPRPAAPPIMRSFYAKKSDAAGHGHTVELTGRNAVGRERPPQGHTDACTRRP